MQKKTSMLTDPTGPIVTGERTLRALLAIRKEGLLTALYDKHIVLARSNHDAMHDVMAEPLPFIEVIDDPPDVELPKRCLTATSGEAATIRLALALPASIVHLEGPIKERAKLSFMKAEGTVSILVAAYREGHLSAVKPMVKALKALGHGDVLPEPAMLEALWQALEGCE